MASSPRRQHPNARTHHHPDRWAAVTKLLTAAANLTAALIQAISG